MYRGHKKGGFAFGQDDASRHLCSLINCNERYVISEIDKNELRPTYREKTYIVLACLDNLYSYG